MDWTLSADALDVAFVEPGAMERPIDYRLSTGRALLRGRVFDVTVHSWDLAQAVGADFTLDERLVAACLATPFAAIWRVARACPRPRIMSNWRQAPPARCRRKHRTSNAFSGCAVARHRYDDKEGHVDAVPAVRLRQLVGTMLVVDNRRRGSLGARASCRYTLACSARPLFRRAGLECWAGEHKNQSGCPTRPRKPFEAARILGDRLGGRANNGVPERAARQAGGG